MVPSTFVLLVCLASIQAATPPDTGSIARGWAPAVGFHPTFARGGTEQMLRLGFRPVIAQSSAVVEREDLGSTPALTLKSFSSAGQYDFVRSYELSRFDCALKGAGAGTTLGLCLAALANSNGMYHERTAWYVGGACAAVGAILGGTVGADNSAWNVGYEWEP